MIAVIQLVDPRNTEAQANLIADLDAKLKLAREGRLTDWVACFVIDGEFVMSSGACSKLEAIAYSAMLHHHMVEEMKR